MDNSRERMVVLAAVDDIFFLSRIESVAKGRGVELVKAIDADQLNRQLDSLVPRLIILDLNSKTCSPLNAVCRIKSDPKLSRTPIIGFLSHVQIELERAALDAGCDRVMARSAFSAKLSKILELEDGQPAPKQKRQRLDQPPRTLRRKSGGKSCVRGR